MHRYGRNISNRLHIPDLAEQFFLCKYMIRILCKKCEQIKLFRGECFLFAIDPHPSGRLINLDAADLNDLIFLHTASYQTLIPGHMRLYTRYQFTGTEGLCHIIVCSKTKTSNLVNIVLLS